MGIGSQIREASLKGLEKVDNQLGVMMAHILQWALGQALCSIYIVFNPHNNPVGWGCRIPTLHSGILLILPNSLFHWCFTPAQETGVCICTLIVQKSPQAVVPPQNLQAWNKESCWPCAQASVPQLPSPLVQPLPVTSPLVISADNSICKSNYQPQEGKGFLPEDVIMSGK